LYALLSPHSVSDACCASQQHDPINVLDTAGMHEHEAYTGDRTLQALTDFADALVPSAGQPHIKHGKLAAAPKTSGCNMAGLQSIYGLRSGRQHDLQGARWLQCKEFFFL